MLKKIRVGVIGAGAMGQNHIRNYAQIEKVQLVGIADPDPQKAELAKQYGVEFYTDYKELLKKDLDAVSIVVPTTLHAQVALDAIRSGINVLVEKPIADTVENAEKIISEAKSRNVKLMVGHIERFNPAVKELKRLVDKGVFGDIVAMSAKRVGPHNHRIRDVGIIIDLGIHDIDIMSYLYGEKVSKVYATAGVANHTKEDHAVIIMKFNNGHSGVIETNWLTPHKIRELTITGTKAIAHLDYIKPDLVIYGNGHEIIKIEEKEPLRLELEHFVDCVENGNEPMADGESALHALKVALAAVESHNDVEAVQVL
ncbi:Gfo/Idh/MocA family oxidoreductase [Candidatus Micrarchaeota archaeon]|nr:Gfo/Idh/MocA family oxidoreductase [Candidatus Micrarchaeota archaeon]